MYLSSEVWVLSRSLSFEKVKIARRREFKDGKTKMPAYITPATLLRCHFHTSRNARSLDDTFEVKLECGFDN